MKTREIKFRAWVIRSEAADKINTMRYESNDVIFDWAHNGVTMEIMQFTGLLDKNGKEAYYGDIIEHSTTEGGIFRRIISWDDELQCTMIDGFPYYRLHESGYIQPSKLVFEIIGNIYETPDLVS